MKRGILIAVLVIVIFMIFLALIGGFIYLHFSQEPYIPENSFLKINLIGKIIDSDDSLLSNLISVRDIWHHIKRAKIDKRIRGIILKISSIYTGFAKVDDIGRLLKDFRKSGKKVYAFIEFGGIKEYYLATFADKVYVFKEGELFLKGLTVEAMFIKNTLSKLGIKAELFQIGEYKTATNMFTENKMTPAHRESLQKLLDDIYNSTLKGIAKNRNLNIELIKQVVEDSPTSNQAYLKAKFIDGLAYEDEILKDLKTDYKIVNFRTYKQTTSPLPYKGNKKIAVIFASGEIHSGKSGKQSMTQGKILGSHTLAEQLKSVRKDPSVKAVVLRVDSPGGSSIASNSILRETKLLTDKKPLVISMSDLAASGGYMISLHSSKIMALPQTITGSIGVLGGKFILKGLYDKIGVNKEILKTTEYADIFSDYKEFNEHEKVKFKRIMKRIYTSFIKTVSKSRNIKIEDVDKVARGRVWAGDTAIKLNLIDKIGGISDAIEEAKKLAKIPASEKIGIKIYPKKKSIWDLIFDSLNNKMKSSIYDTFEKNINLYKSFFPALVTPYKIQIN